MKKILAPLLLVLLAWDGLAWDGAPAFAQTDPTTEPVPAPEYVDDARSFLASLDFSAPDRATVAGLSVVNGPTPGTAHLLRDLSITTLGGGGKLSEFTITHPSTAFMDGVGEVFDRGVREFRVPLDTIAEQIVVNHIATGNQVAVIDAEPGVIAACVATPLARECAYDLVAELVAEPEPVPAGTTLAYRIDVRNAGTGPALATTLTVDLPFPPAATPAGCRLTDKRLACALSRVNAGETKTIPVGVRVPSSAGGTTLEARAGVASAAWAEADTGDNAVSLASTVIAVSDLVLVKEGEPAQATANDLVTYRVSVTNKGPSDADQLRIVDQLPPPAEAELVSAELPGGECDAQVRCDLKSPLRPNETVDATVVVKVSDTGDETELVNTAHVASASHDPNPGDNSDAATTTVLRAPTTLDVEPVLLRVELLQIRVNLGRVSATLARADTGEPVVGRVLRFEAGDTLLCTAITDANGEAGCSGLGLTLVALLNLGYRVSFDGDGRYQPAVGEGDLILIRI